MVVNKLVNRALIWILLLAVHAMAAAAAIGPKAQVLETTFDFGEVFEDRKLTHTFTIKNIGDTLLEIKDIDSDCACTTAVLRPAHPPRRRGPYHPDHCPLLGAPAIHQKNQGVLQRPGPSQVVLTLQGYGKPFIEIQPSHIIRFRGKPGEDLKGQVRFTSHLPDPWEITGFKTNIPQFIDVAVKAEAPGRIYVVEVRNKRQEAGNYAGVIELSTTSKQRPRLIMRVFGELSLPSAGSP